MAIFVDDILGYGHTKRQAEDRQRIISMALKKLGQRLSDTCKLDRTVREEGAIAGMVFNKDGVVITDEAVDALVAAMGEPVKSEKAARVWWA